MHKIVSHVTFELHHTYRGKRLQKIMCKPGDSELWYRRDAYGYFDLPTVIYFRPELNMKPLHCEFELAFEPGGRQFTV